MRMQNILSVFIYTYLLVLVSAKVFYVEVENYVPKAMRKPRSNASGDYSVLLLEGQSLKVDFCLRAESRINIRDILYANDGYEDIVTVYIDGDVIGQFQSPLIEIDGKGWNIFRSAGPFPNSPTLHIGRHTILINVTKADNWGIELDYILLDINDNLLEYTDFMCHLYCFDDIEYDSFPRKDSIPSGRFLQKSFETRCAEQDNVHIEVFHDNAKDFEIVANLPKYMSFSNNRDPRYDNCKLGSPYWFFQNVSIKPREDVNKKYARLQLSGSKVRVIMLVRFSFDSFTNSRELDERFIGSVLTLKLRNMPREDVRVRPEYLKHGAWIPLSSKVFTPFNVEQSWTIPDRSWRVQGQNYVRLFVQPGRQRVVLESLSLTKRSVSDTTFEMHSDSDIVIQGVRLGFWHHWNDRPMAMVVTVANTTHKKVDSIRIYSKVPWTGNYSQTFVLFQDSRIRLQAVTPHGLDNVPFGSSVYIGQPQSLNQKRPYSPIKSITIDPVTVHMSVEYVDGNKATFILKTSFTKTRLLVTHAMFRKDRRIFPLISFKSMWVNDGNSDVDHVTINGGISRHVMSGWRELYGISAVFFRKCISRHNTQGPDLTIQFIEPSEA